MASKVETGVEYVVLWDWETVDQIPNNRYRHRDSDAAVLEASGTQGRIAGETGSLGYPAFRVVKRKIERTTITGQWEDA